MRLKKRYVLIPISISILIIVWLLAPNIKTPPNSNMKELSSIIGLSTSIEKVKWEIFETPESTDFVPAAPTDYVTLIAEMQSAKTKSLYDDAGSSKAFWIPPEAGRHWLSPKFKAMLENKSPSMLNLHNCKVIKIELKKTDRLKDGLVCNENELTLLIVTLYDYTYKVVHYPDPSNVSTE